MYIFAILVHIAFRKVLWEGVKIEILKGCSYEETREVINEANSSIGRIIKMSKKNHFNTRKTRLLFYALTLISWIGLFNFLFNLE